MKKLLLSAAFVLALSGFAAAQQTEGTTTSATKTEAASLEKIDKEKSVTKLSRKEKKAIAAAEAYKNLKIVIPKTEIKESDTMPPMPKQ